MSLYNDCIVIYVNSKLIALSSVITLTMCTTCQILGKTYLHTWSMKHCEIHQHKIMSWPGICINTCHKNWWLLVHHAHWNHLPSFLHRLSCGCDAENFQDHCKAFDLTDHVLPCTYLTFNTSFFKFPLLECILLQLFHLQDSRFVIAIHMYT